MSDLTQKKCMPCEGGVVPFNRAEADVLMKQLDGWTLTEDGKSISKTYTFKDYAGTVAFGNKIAALAESEGHHPDMLIAWGKLTVHTWTHAIDGLSENDFIIAAKIDRIKLTHDQADIA